MSASPTSNRRFRRRTRATANANERAAHGRPPVRARTAPVGASPERFLAVLGGTAAERTGVPNRLLERLFPLTQGHRGGRTRTCNPRFWRRAVFGLVMRCSSSAPQSAPQRQAGDRSRQVNPGESHISAQKWSISSRHLRRADLKAAQGLDRISVEASVDVEAHRIAS
jgi:hypothetical protein